MDWKEVLEQIVLDGGPSTCQFAITDACNAKCEFCNFSRERTGETKSFVKLEDGIKAIDSLYRNGVRFIIFTGGEPTLNPHLAAFMEHCQRLGIVTLVVTNGSTLSEDKIHDLIDKGLKEIIISVDSVDHQVCEENRGLPGVSENIRRANAIFKENKIGSVASVTLSKILGDLQSLPDSLRDLGFEAVTFSFPLTKLESNYLGCRDDELVSYTTEELHHLINEVLKLKKSFKVLNSKESLLDMHRYLDGEPQRFVCLGGFKQFYLDWNLQLWRCCNWKTPMCHVSDFNGSQVVRDGCTSCMIDCYRDTGVLQHCAVSLSDGVHSICCDKWARAWHQWINLDNWRSLRSVIENYHWLNNLK